MTIKSKMAGLTNKLPTLAQLLPLLDAGDILIDGGNSHFRDSNRRWRELAAKGIHFVGMGVSGGEEGARYGPSLMPGGAVAAWPTIRDMFQSIAAKVDGIPCCQWLGDGGGCSGFQYGFTFDEVTNEDDTTMTKNGVSLLIDAMSYQYLVGAEIDYKEDLTGAQFVIKNPNATTTCGCGSSFSAG